MIRRILNFFRRRPPNVAVLVATHRKNGFYIPMEALRLQTRRPDQLILVTDGVTLSEALGPATLPWSLRSITPVFVEHHSTYGSAVPFNRGLDRVHPHIDYLFVLADNTYVRETWIERHLALHQTYKPALVSGFTKLHDETDPFRFPGEFCACRGTWMPFKPSVGAHELSRQFHLLDIVGRLPTGQAAAEAVYNSSLSIRMDLMQKIGGWDERFEGGYGYDDFLLAHRAEAHSGRDCVISHDPDVIAHRLGRPVSASNKPKPEMETNYALFERLRSNVFELLQPAYRIPRRHL